VEALNPRKSNKRANKKAFLIYRETLIFLEVKKG
jgi:hypothetical protein